ncbi:uncharacterized protein LOC135831043 isoform X2 [Sycon ciliatum]|uniref:uncharacterized protein LOC135831043 isoform X2 n=1 Tax=Sycon ciliatum TaxID=27933 RepID=UPI0031F6A5E7
MRQPCLSWIVQLTAYILARHLLLHVGSTAGQALTWAHCVNTTYEYLYSGTVKKNFSAAATYCSTTYAGGQLATARNAVEDECVFKSKPMVTIWLAIHRVNGTWLDYETQTEVTYTNWEPGEPNKAEQNCVTMWYNPPLVSGDQWDNLGCGKSVTFVCQRKANVTCATSSNNSLVNGYTSHYGVLYPGNITYQCNPGYYISGQSNQSITSHTSLCLISGHWSTPEPTCGGITCMAPPPALANSSILSQELVYPGIVTYQCDVGYYVAGYAEQNVSNATVQCAPNGTWIGTPPICLRITCLPLPPMANGTLSFTNSLYYESVATYRCDQGYHVNDSVFSITKQDLTCEADGTWNMPPVTCTIVTCQNLSSIVQNGKVKADGKEFNSTRAYYCQTGYYISTFGNFSVTAFTMRCLSNGSWNAPVPMCNVVTCQSLYDRVLNGKVQVSGGVEYKSNRTYTCQHGYYIAESSRFSVTTLTMHCLSDGSWSASAPTCEVIKCQKLSDKVLNGKVKSYGMEYNSNRTYHCQDGYYMLASGNFSVTTLTMHCLINGSWSAPAPTCEVIKCQKLSDTVLNGKVKSYGIEYKSNRTYHCQDGYYMSASGKFSVTTMTMHCLINGSWSAPVPTCAAIVCPDLPSTLQNGSVQSFGLEYTNNRTYECQHGFFISSAAMFSVTSLTMRCLLNGSWSAPVPTCTRITCSQVPLRITRAWTLASGSNYFSDSVKYTCYVGNYIKASGDITKRVVKMSCLLNGSWSDSVPTCSFVPCPALKKSLANGTFNGFQPLFGRRYTYTCKSGYHIAGSAALVTDTAIVCQSNGTWSGPVPTCAAVTCSSIPTSLDNGTAAYLTPSSSNTAGAAIKYTCLPGYYVQNETMTSVTSRVLSCQLDASWNDTVPACAADNSYCPGLNRILNGKVVATNGLALQSIAIYSCLAGYKLTGSANQRACQVNMTWSGAEPSCANIDECVLGVDTCNRVNGTCTDTSGSYSCSCNPGYAGDGRQCTVVCKDQCIAGQGYCTAPDHCDCIGEYSGLSCQNLWPAVDSIITASISSISSFSTYVQRLTSFSAADGDHHPGRCAVGCVQNGYLFGGMADGAECYCTSFAVSKLTAAVGDTFECAGAPEYQCGGNNSISFYKLREAPPFKAHVASRTDKAILINGIVYALTGTTIIVECTVIAGTAPLVYTWRKAGSDMLLSSSSVLGRIVTSSDTADYVCTVSNPRVTKSPNFTLPYNTSVSVPLVVQAPVLAAISSLGDQAAEGSSVNATCTVHNSTSGVSFTWQRFDPATGMVSHLPSRASFGARTGVLLITRVLMSDQGVYRCVATDPSIAFMAYRSSMVEWTLSVVAGDACAGECSHSNATECNRTTGLCQCHNGFTGNALKSCSDINECTVHTCPVSTPVCVNSIGSYSCVDKCTADASSDGCPGSDNQSGSGSLGVPALAGIGAAGFLLILLILIIVIVTRRRKRSGMKLDRDGDHRHSASSTVALVEMSKCGDSQRYSDVGEAAGGSHVKKSKAGKLGKVKWTPSTNYESENGLTSAMHQDGKVSITLGEGEEDTYDRTVRETDGKPMAESVLSDGDTYDSLNAPGVTAGCTGGAEDSNEYDTTVRNDGIVVGNGNPGEDTYDMLNRDASATDHQQPHSQEEMYDRLQANDDMYNVLSRDQANSGDLVIANGTGEEYDSLGPRLSVQQPRPSPKPKLVAASRNSKATSIAYEVHDIDPDGRQASKRPVSEAVKPSVPAHAVPSRPASTVNPTEYTYSEPEGIHHTAKQDGRSREAAAAAAAHITSDSCSAVVSKPFNEVTKQGYVYSRPDGIHHTTEIDSLRRPDDYSYATPEGIDHAKKGVKRSASPAVPYDDVATPGTSLEPTPGAPLPTPRNPSANHVPTASGHLVARQDAQSESDRMKKKRPTPQGKAVQVGRLQGTSGGNEKPPKAPKKAELTSAAANAKTSEAEVPSAASGKGMNKRVRKRG